MARITPQTARLLADELIKAGRARVTDRDSLIQRLIAQAEATGDASPETAIGSALMMPVARTVTPATPAPMQPGVPLVAPKPVAEAPVEIATTAPQRAAPRPSRYRSMLDATLADLGSAQEAMGENPDPVARVRVETLRQRAQRLQDMVQAEEGPEAELPEEMRAAMEGRQQRLARREELLAEARARSPWEALLAGGAAMAQGRRGERFTEALARGLQTGIQQYNQARRSGEEGEESIAEARDQAMIDRYNMQERAREAARQRALEIQGIDEAGRRRAVEEVRLPTQLRGEEAGTALAEFKARNAPAEAASEQALRAAQAAYYLDGRGRGGGSKVDVEGRADRDELDDAAAEYEGARAAYNAALREGGMKASTVPAELSNAMLSARAKLEARSRAFKRKYGSSPYIGAEPQRATSSRTAISADPLGIRR